jgi:hypothetical protein
LFIDRFTFTDVRFDPELCFEDNIKNYINSQRFADAAHPILAQVQQVDEHTLVPVWFVVDILILFLNMNVKKNFPEVMSYLLSDPFCVVCSPIRVSNARWFRLSRLSYNFAFVIVTDANFASFLSMMSQNHDYDTSITHSNRGIIHRTCQSCGTNTTCIRIVNVHYDSEFLKVDMMCPVLYGILSANVSI